MLKVMNKWERRFWKTLAVIAVLMTGMNVFLNCRNGDTCGFSQRGIVGEIQELREDER